MLNFLVAFSQTLTHPPSFLLLTCHDLRSHWTFVSCRFFSQTNSSNLLALAPLVRSPYNPPPLPWQFHLLKTYFSSLKRVSSCCVRSRFASHWTLPLLSVWRFAWTSSLADEGPETENDSDEDIIHSYLPQGDLIHHPFFLPDKR